MSFNIGLSGLNAASSDLSVTANNISNAATTGFKESRAEFADVYALSPFGNGSTAIGSGVLLSNVAQQFNQGNLEFTENALDLAINGPGFFTLAPTLTSTERIYSRAGAFGVNENGFIVNSTGQFLVSFPVNQDGTVTSTSLGTATPVQIPAAAGTPQATSEIEIGLNLPANAAELDPALFDPDNPSTFTNSTSVTIFDSLGDAHIATTYYVKQTPVAGPPASSPWAVYLYVDGVATDIPGGTAGSPAAGVNYAELVFDEAGNLASTSPAPIEGIAVALTNGASDLDLTLDFANNVPTQYAGPFSVNVLSQDGFTTGQLSGLDISEDGLIRANFTNGQFVALGKVALTNFRNPQGLRQLGNTSWAQTIGSGEPVTGEAGTGTFGLVRSGALEASNVDLTRELVRLITAQRNFQANAKTIETSSNVTQTIININ
ncbi:MAG: flagellar hook protein FlgE [Chromatiales bacterium]|nr:flagellar hook protein FlgE [Chromatiales bacterium]